MTGETIRRRKISSPPRAILRVAERELARGPSSTAETRQWLRATSSAFGVDSQTVDSVVLVASELLANAFLHACGPYSVVLEVEPAVLRVGVRDRSLTMPVQKAFDELAATGRGLHIVAASSLEWGYDPHVDGKTVWATLPLASHRTNALVDGGRTDLFPLPGGTSRTSSNAPSEPHGDRTRSRSGHGQSMPGPLARVWYLGVPVASFVAMRERIEAMLRESTLIALGRSREELPGELRALVERVTARFRPVARAEASASPEPVRTDGEGTGDFSVELPVSVSSQLRSFAAVVRELNSWCESSHLLVTPLTRDMLELHSWSVEEAIRQLQDEKDPQPFAA